MKQVIYDLLNKKLKLGFNCMKQWTIKEIKILRDNYRAKSCEKLCKLLLNRSWRAIETKASRLKLCHQVGTPKQRFWKYVDKKPKDDCWNWIGACDKDGYGLIGVNKKLISAHRFSWEIHFDKIPKNLCVLHHCDNPSCVNPHHLFLGTQQDNVDDKVKKNRQARGEDNGASKLTWNKITQIRQLKGKFSQREIAKIFNVSHATIGYIHRNKIWKHIK